MEEDEKNVHSAHFSPSCFISMIVFFQAGESFAIQGPFFERDGSAEYHACKAHRLKKKKALKKSGRTIAKRIVVCYNDREWKGRKRVKANHAHLGGFMVLNIMIPRTRWGNIFLPIQKAGSCQEAEYRFGEQ